jgi:hypothetical protein
MKTFKEFMNGNHAPIKDNSYNRSYPLSLIAMHFLAVSIVPGCQAIGTSKGKAFKPIIQPYFRKEMSRKDNMMMDFRQIVAQRVGTLVIAWRTINLTSSLDFLYAHFRE